MVRLRHHRPAQRGRGHPAHHPDGPLGRPGRLDLCRRRLHRGDPARLGRPRRRPVGARHPLPGRHLLPVLRRHPDHDHRRAQRQRRRGGHRPDPDRPLDRLRRPGGRASPRRQRQPGRLQVDVRPLAVHRPRRHPLPLLRLLLRRDLRHRAERGRDQGRRRADHGGHRQPLRGRLRGPPRPLVLPVRLRGQLLRRPDHRLHGVRGPVGQPEGAVQRPRRHPAGDLAGRRHHRGHPQRQHLGRHRPQRGRHRPGRPGLVRLPRHRPPRPLPGRAVRHQRAADAARPAGLGRRLADGPGRPLGLRRPAAGPGHRLGGRRRRVRAAPGGGLLRARRRAGPRPLDGRVPGRGRPAPGRGHGRRRARHQLAEQGQPPGQLARPRGRGPGHRRGPRRQVARAGGQPPARTASATTPGTTWPPSCVAGS